MKSIAALWFLITVNSALAADLFPVVTIPLVKTDVHDSITAFGVLEKDVQQLFFEIDGYLLEMRVGNGDHVEKGQVLAKLNTIDIDNRVLQARQTKQRNREIVAYNRKLRISNNVSQDKLDDVEHKFALSDLEHMRLVEEQRKHTLYAPSSGLLLERLVDFAGPVRKDTPIFTMKSNQQPWTVTAEISEQQARRVLVGNNVGVYFSGIGGFLNAKVLNVLSTANGNNNMVECKIVIDDRNEALRAGLRVSVSIDTSSHRGYLIPLNALLSPQGNRAEVFVVEKANGKARKIKIQYDWIKGTDAVTSTDLSRFSAVIINGQHQLRDGSSVESIGEITE